MRIDLLTLFPEIFTGFQSESILHRALTRKLMEIHVANLRDWSNDPHLRVDDRPFGGGPGMVLRVEPVVLAVEALRQRAADPGRLILLTPQGRPLDQPLVEDLATANRLILICGRYEGFDHRVVEILQPEEISLGPFVINGGEVAAMAIIEAVMRLIPGALGDERSSQEDSFSQQGRFLEAEQYTRPRSFRGHEVPDVLLTGNHRAIEDWRAERSRQRTRERYPHELTRRTEPCATEI